MKPKVVIMVDVENWAWARKAQHLRRWLADDFNITIWYQKYGPVPAIFDLYHTFDFPNVTWVPAGKKCVTGITAHVWPTWGETKLRAWAERAEAIHTNSRLLEADMQPFADATRQGKVYYTPNGVCPEQFHRVSPRRTAGPFIVGHQGKPNPRKGSDVLRAAVDVAHRLGEDVEFRLLQKTSADALSAGGMLAWYQDLDLILVASDMDGTPNPALEAAACEVAVLTNGIGNMPEFIEQGVNGWMIEGLEPFGFGRGPMPGRAVDQPDKTRLIFDYADQIIAAAKQRDVVHEMGRAARRTVLADWTWEAQAENYRTMWAEVLG